MSAEVLLVRLLLTLPAALGGLLLVKSLCGILRLRDPRLRGALALVAAADTLLTIAGLSCQGFFLVLLSVDPDRLREVVGPWTVPGLAAWLAVAVLGVGRRVRRQRRLVASVRALAVLDPAPADVRAEVASVAARARVRLPSVWVGEGVDSPFLAGGVLVLPRGFGSGLAPEARRSTLAHEMAHLRRRDETTGLALGILGDLLWFNPAFRALLRAWGRECEALTDRLALRIGATPRGLARGLAGLIGTGVGPRGPGPALGVESPRSIARRLGLLARRPRRRILIVQVLLLALLFPLTPGRGSVRLVTRPLPPGRHGELFLGLGLATNSILAQLVLPPLPRR